MTVLARPGIGTNYPGSERLALTPEDLGLRITYLATGPVTETSVPDCDLALPFAVEP